MLLATAGCDLFGVRDPVEPVPSLKRVPEVAPTSPEATLTNIETGIRCKLAGVNLYGRSLGTELGGDLLTLFALELDPSDAEGLPFAALTAEQSEQAQSTRSAADADSFGFAWDESDPNYSVEPLGGDRTRFNNMRYRIDFFAEGAEEPRTDIVVRGICDLVIAADEFGNWVVESWRDGRPADLQQGESTFGFWQGEVAPAGS